MDGWEDRFLEQITLIRQRHKLSEAEFAWKIDVRPFTVHLWLQRKSLPSIVTIIKICDVFHTTPNKLFGFKTERSKK